MVVSCTSFLRRLAIRLCDREQARQELQLPPRTWHPGDKALCVESVDWRAFETPQGKILRGPWTGSLLRVAEVLEHDGETYLAFENFPNRAYRARHFVRPRQQPPIEHNAVETA